MQLVCDKSTALVSKMRVGTSSEIDLLDNVDFSATDNDNYNKQSSVINLYNPIWKFELDICFDCTLHISHCSPILVKTDLLKDAAFTTLYGSKTLSNCLRSTELNPLFSSSHLNITSFHVPPFFGFGST